MKKILIYDDDEKWATSLKRGLEELAILSDVFEIVVLTEETFRTSMSVQEERQRSFREKGKWHDKKIELDKASIFIVDYDLFETNAFLTGEDVAYFARCFSDCGSIIALNQPPISDFDLTLRGHPKSFADLNISGEQLSNPNLWGGTGSDFRPWYWPLLPNHHSDFEKKVEDVKQNLDRPVCEVLNDGFDPELFDMLPRALSQFIGNEPSKTTFRKFIEESGNGLRRKDIVTGANEKVLARVGAARISKWLERLILPELDILVDAPHLASRYPSLLIGDKADIETWNRTAKLASHTELGLQVEMIEPYRLKKDYWLSRPAWFWDGLRECEDILEVREPWSATRPDWVFCEDISRFSTEDYREFIADVESPFARRFVKYFDNLEYRPRVRFSL